MTGFSLLKRGATGEISPPCQLSNGPGTGSHLTLLASDQNPMETKVTCLYARNEKITNT